MSAAAAGCNGGGGGFSRVKVWRRQLLVVEEPF
jgi:hypothetical protein